MVNHPEVEQLIVKCKESDPKSQKRLYELFSGKMFALCLRYTGSPDDAQDILQNGFIKMFRKIRDFRSEGSFEGWLRRIMVTSSIEYYRKNKSLSAMQPIDEEVSRNTADHVTVLDKMQADELGALFSKLAPRYRTVLNMYAVEGYSHREIGEMLGISEGTSKSQLSRARELLKQMLSKMEGSNNETVVR